MKGYKPVISFDEDVARSDRDFQRGDEVPAVAFLEQLAGPGPALELGIGTGRIALPLAARGVRVDGIDLSRAMVDQLRAKPGGDGLAATIGDFADVPAFLYRLRNDQHVDAEAIEVDEVRLDVLRHYPARQMLEESHVSLSQAGVRLNPVVQRYAWPSELDLMARIAGLRLKGRWGGWEREPFDSSSIAHVSVYGR
jgi:hypothetical protein